MKGILPYIKIPLEEGNIFAIHSDDPTIPFMFNCHNGGPEILSNLWIPKRGWTRYQEYTLPYTKAFFTFFAIKLPVAIRDRSALSDRLVVYFPSATSFAVGTFSYRNGITGLQSKPNGDFRGNFYFLVVDLDGLD